MIILIESEKEKIDSYIFEINMNNNLLKKTEPSSSILEVSIIFKNNKFDKVIECNIVELIERSKWYVYHTIAEKIKEIENQYFETLLVIPEPPPIPEPPSVSVVGPGNLLK